MSIEAKHAYRFGYLKSEEWQSVRLAALVRENGCCQICAEESVSNDAHHIWYPENIYDTRPAHLAVLCRACHDFIHTMLPECKTSDEEHGMQTWRRFKNAIIAWRTSKHTLFADEVTGPATGIRELRKAYEALRQSKTVIKTVEKVRTIEKLHLSPDDELTVVVQCIGKWARAYKKSVDTESETVNGLFKNESRD